MSRNTGNPTCGLISFFIIIALVVILILISLIPPVVENPWILVPIAAVVVIAFFIIRSIRKEKKQETIRLEELRLEEEQKINELRIEEETRRKDEILSHQTEWGQDKCELLLERRIAIGMTDEMVRLAIGEPSNIDEKVVTKNVSKSRWIYGQPRHGASYIWFRNGIVTKIKQ